MPSRVIEEISDTGGWCAPSDFMRNIISPPYQVMPEDWPVGLLDADLEWIACMLWMCEIYPVSMSSIFDLPDFAVQRGGLRWPSSV